MITAVTLASVESDILQKTEVLAVFLRGVASQDLGAARHILEKIVARLDDEITSYEALAAAPVASKPRLVQTRPAQPDEVEEFIFQSLEASQRGLSVQEIFDCFEEAQIPIRRQTLVVRLHRMVRADKLVARAHGHYILSESQNRMRSVS